MKLYPNISLIFIIWLLAVLTISYFGFLTLPHSGKFNGDFLKSLANWDGGHYLGIAQFGVSEKFQYAFFPFYPLIIRILNQVIQNYQMSAILISGLSAFLGIHLLYKLISKDFDKRIAEKVILTLLFFPTSFYFLTAYSEGLFFFLVVACFYFLRSHKLFWATIFASLASATRLVGLALVLGLLIEIITTSGINRKNWFVLLSPVGFLIYCGYLYNHTGDPFYFISAENHWQRYITAPVISFWETIKSLSQNGFIEKNFTALLDLIFAIFGVGFAIRTFRFLPPAYSIYSLASVIIPLFTPTLASMPRFLLPVFPLFILVSLTKNKYMNLTFQIFSLMLLAIFSVLFVNGYWVS